MSDHTARASAIAATLKEPELALAAEALRRAAVSCRQLGLAPGEAAKLFALAFTESGKIDPAAFKDPDDFDDF